MINEIVNNIKGRLGSHIRKLELSDEAIVNCLQTETLNTLSIYYPFYCEYILDTEVERVPGTQNSYYVPNEIEGFRVFSVDKVFPTSQSFASSSMAFAVIGNDITSAISNFVNMKMGASIASAFLAPDTFQFIPPNILRLYNNHAERSMILTLKTTHKKDFSTLNYGLRETIMKLAMADVCADLLGIRKYFQNLSTTFAEINLDLDILSSFVDKREDVIAELRKNLLRGAGTKKIYIA